MEHNKSLNPNALAPFDSYAKKQHTIDCGLGTNPLGEPPAVKDFWKTYMHKPVDKYYDPALLAELSARVSDYANIPVERLFFHNGSMQMLSTLFFKLFTQHPKLMMGIGPQFAEPVEEWLLSGGEYISSPLGKADNLDFTVNKIIEKITSTKPTVVFMDNPNNPTGLFFSVEFIERIAIACQHTGTYLIIDEAFADYLPVNSSAMHLTNHLSNIFVVRSFSKALGMASIRLGYCIVPNTLIKYLQRIIIQFTPAEISIDIACHVLPSINDFLLKSRHYIRQGKKKITETFRQKGFRIWPTHKDVPIFLAYHKEIPIYRCLQDIDVITVSGDHFAITCPEMNDHYCRVRVPACKADIAYLIHRVNNLAIN
jgi:histidinol-phosphate aminotransferase